MRGTRRAYWLVALFTLTGAAVSDSSAARKKAVPMPKAGKAATPAASVATPAAASAPAAKTPASTTAAASASTTAVTPAAPASKTTTATPTATAPAPAAATTTTAGSASAASTAGKATAQAPASAAAATTATAPAVAATPAAPAAPAVVAAPAAPAAPVVPRPAPGTLMVRTIVAAGDSGYQDGPGAMARFDTVEGAALIGTDLYVSDGNGTAVIRRVNLLDGTVSTLVGKHRESSTVNGSFAESRLTRPGPMVAVGKTLYVIQLGSEHGGTCIRSIDLAAQRTDTLTGNCDRKGNLDGDKATALFASPRALATDGKTLYVADYVRVRAVSLATGAVTTLAGEADAQCDFGLQRICKGGWVDGVGNEARFDGIRALALADRRLFVADGDAIRALDLDTRKVTTVVGSKRNQAVVSDGIGAKATVGSVSAIAAAPGGLLILQGPYSVGLRYLNLATGAVVSLTGLALHPLARGQKNVDGPAVNADFLSPKLLVPYGDRALIIQERGRIRVYEKAD